MAELPTKRLSPESSEVSRMRRRVLWSSYLGGVVEWYDFYLYATASALVFNVLFFPTLSPAVGVIASFGTLAVGWVARPIGGLIAGHFGDTLGRKQMLMITFVGMGIASTLIGVLPTYAVAGIWAPILLVVLRLIQGLCAGGEYGGALLMSVEHAPTRRRGLFSSVSLIAITSGVLLANGVFLLVNSTMSNEAMLSWGWRILFVVSLALVGVTYWVRHSIEESPIFREAVADSDGGTSVQDAASGRVSRGRPSPLLELLRNNPRVLLISLTLMLGPAAISAIFTYLAAYSVQIGYSRNVSLIFLVLQSCVGFVGAVLWTSLSDRIGRKRLVITGVVLLAIYSFVIFRIYDVGSIGFTLVGLGIFVLLHGMAYSPISVWLSELFPTKQRYTGVSFAYQIGATLGAGFTPVIAASLLYAAGGPPNTLYISLFLAGMLLLTLVGASLSRDESRTSLAEVGVGASAGANTSR
jgi:MFS transporter, MHS family, shikimate and dehydroshikimate transport protein